MGVKKHIKRVEAHLTYSNRSDVHWTNHRIGPTESMFLGLWQIGAPSQSSVPSNDPLDSAHKSLLRGLRILMHGTRSDVHRTHSIRSGRYNSRLTWHWRGKSDVPPDRSGEHWQLYLSIIDGTVHNERSSVASLMTKFCSGLPTEWQIYFSWHIFYFISILVYLCRYPKYGYPLLLYQGETLVATIEDSTSG